MTNTLDKIRQLRQDAIDAKTQIEQKIASTQARINEVAQHGTVSFDEAFNKWHTQFIAYAEKGRHAFELNLADFARPFHEHPKTGQAPRRDSASDAFAIRTNASGEVMDCGHVFAHINREAIIEQARAWFENKCAECNVPPAEEREAELEKLAGELKALEEERDEIQDELSELFRMEPSETTKRARKAEHRESTLERFNGPIREKNERNVPPRLSRARSRFPTKMVATLKTLNMARRFAGRDNECVGLEMQDGAPRAAVPFAAVLPGFGRPAFETTTAARVPREHWRRAGHLFNP